MRRRLIHIMMGLVFAALVACIPAMSGDLGTIEVYAAGNPYPQYNYYNSASDYQIACTWYAWQQAYERLGLSLPAWGNGGNWYSNTNFSKGSDPRAMSIACWSSTDSPPYGHVAYVTGVNGDGSINIVEGGSGWSGNDHGICSRTVKQGRYWPDQGFIYLNGSNNITVTFSDWESSGKTYVGSTDASIGQQVNVSGGSWTGVGMILYSNDGNELGRAGDTPTQNIPYYYYKINSELHVSLNPSTTYKYRFYAVIDNKTYYSDYKSFTTLPLTVSFSEWSNGNYTYVGETDAAIGQEINLSGGTCTETGMYLFDNDGNHIATARQNTYYYRIYFKINEECGYTLRHATTYKYKFYAVVDGNTYWGNEGSFTTSGSHSWDNGVIIQEPSNASEGIIQYTCTSCGETRRETLNKTDDPVLPDTPAEPETDNTVTWGDPYAFPSKRSALVSTTASTEGKKNFSEASIKVWDSNDILVASLIENSSVNTTSSLPIWYDIYSETGALLEPASKYSYQISVVVNGKEYHSPLWTFTTEDGKGGHYGIDVSSHQGDIDWEKASKYIDFAIIRCGFGSDYANNDDVYWEKNVQGCEENSIPYGVYLYSYAENDQEAASEADHVLRLLSGKNPSMPVYLDLEDSNTVAKLSNAQILRQTGIFCEKLRSAGYKVGVYASKSWWDSRLIDAEYNNYEKWVAVYSGTYAAQSGNCDIWQYSSSGKVPGISGNVDINYRKESATESDNPSEDPSDPSNTKPGNDPSSNLTTSEDQTVPEITDLPAVKISKISAAKKKFTVKWKKVSKKNQKRIQGIEIQVATDPAFTNIVKTATASRKKTSKKISGLQPKTKYYIRIRAYKNVSDGKHVSVWKTKKVKTR